MPFFFFLYLGVWEVELSKQGAGLTVNDQSEVKVKFSAAGERVVMEYSLLGTSTCKPIFLFTTH